MHITVSTSDIPESPVPGHKGPNPSLSDFFHRSSGLLMRPHAIWRRRPVLGYPSSAPSHGRPSHLISNTTSTEKLLSLPKSALDLPVTVFQRPFYQTLSEVLPGQSLLACLHQLTVRRSRTDLSPKAGIRLAVFYSCLSPRCSANTWHRTDQRFLTSANYSLGPTICHLKIHMPMLHPKTSCFRMSRTEARCLWLTRAPQIILMSNQDRDTAVGP